MRDTWATSRRCRCRRPAAVQYRTNCRRPAPYALQCVKVGLKLRQGGAKTACRWGWGGDFCTDDSCSRHFLQIIKLNRFLCAAIGYNNLPEDRIYHFDFPAYGFIYPQRWNGWMLGIFFKIAYGDHHTLFTCKRRSESSAASSSDNSSFVTRVCFYFSSAISSSYPRSAAKGENIFARLNRAMRGCRKDGSGRDKWRISAYLAATILPSLDFL